MNFDEFKKESSNVLWQSAADWVKASIPKPPGAAAPAPAPAAAAPVLIQALPAQIGGVDQKTILIAGGVLVAALGLVLVLSKKRGRK